MKQFTTIVCSLAFAVFGIAIAMTSLDEYNSGYKSANAATLEYQIPTLDFGKVQLPKDLSLDLAKKNASDTVYITKTDTVLKQVTKVKWRKVRVPSSVIQRDTVKVPVYYLATQVRDKDGPTDECIQVYEVRKTDEICPENTSARRAPQHGSDTE